MSRQTKQYQHSGLLLAAAQVEYNTLKQATPSHLSLPAPPPPPPMYDTSVSTATMNEDSSDGGGRQPLTGSHGTNHNNWRNGSYSKRGAPNGLSGRTNAESSSSSSWIGNNSSRLAVVTNMSNSNVSTNREESAHISQLQHREELVTHSEPGNNEHDRFAAYINRFAELDPRMDHRGKSIPNTNYREEKKQDEPVSSLTAAAVSAAARSHRSTSTTTDRLRFQARAGSEIAAPNGPRMPEVQQDGQIPAASASYRGAATAAKMIQSSGRDISTNHARSETKQSEAALSDTMPTSPSSRTRYLARKFEERMAGRQAVAPVVPPAWKQTNHNEKIPSLRQSRVVEVPNDKSPDKKGSVDHPAVASPNLAQGQRYHHSSAQEVLHGPRTGVHAHNVETGEYLTDEERPGRRGHYIENKNPADEERLGPVPSSESRRNVESNDEAHQQQILSRSGEMKGEERSSSVPPVRRRRKPLQAPAVGAGDLIELNEPFIRRVGRAEIETTSPAKVQELRKKLWTENEDLQVSVRPSFHDTESKGRLNRHWLHYNGPEMAGSAGQRSARSLSPKTQQKGLQFKSRYYEAARREIISPSRCSASTKDGKSTDYTLHSLKSSESSQKANMATEIKPATTKEASNISHHVAQPLRKANTADSAKPEDVAPVPAGNEHLGRLQDASFAKKEETVSSLIKKLGQINRDDPEAALAQIDAILKQGFQSSAFDHNVTELHAAVTRDSTLSGVQQATPMVVSQEDINGVDSDVESTSDETSVSSMTNPTYQEVRNGDKEATAAANGRPRPSALGTYSNSTRYYRLSPTAGLVVENAAKESSIAITTKERPPPQTKTRPPPPASIKVIKSKERSVASLEKERSVADLVADFQAQTNDQLSSMRASEMREKKALEKQANVGVPSFFQMIGTLIAPTTEIEEKVNICDEMSTGVVPIDVALGSQKKGEGRIYSEGVLSTRTETDRGNIVTDKLDFAPGTPKRAHPWDAAMPIRAGEVYVKDTSMDCGDGIEAQYTPKYPSAQLSPDCSLVAPVRRMRKDRISRAMQNVNESRLPKTTSGDESDVESKLMNDKLDGEVAQVFDPRRHEQASAMSDAFDSVWVNLPSSNYFSALSTLDASQRRASSRERGRVTIEREAVTMINSLKYHSDHEEKTDCPPSKTSVLRPNLQTFSPRSGEEEPSDSRVHSALGSARQYPRHNMSAGTFDTIVRTAPAEECGTNSSFETARSSKSTRSRGLMGFLKRKQAAASKTGSKTGSIDQSTFVSASSVRRTNQPLQEGMDAVGGEPVECTPESHRRSAKSRSPSRSRARSLDERRIRNPNIPRTFNRLLRVYDDDKGGRGYI